MQNEFEENVKRIRSEFETNCNWICKCEKKKSEANLKQMESQQVNWSKFIKQCVKVKRIESNFFVI